MHNAQSDAPNPLREIIRRTKTLTRAYDLALGDLGEIHQLLVDFLAEVFDKQSTPPHEEGLPLTLTFRKGHFLTEVSWDTGAVSCSLQLEPVRSARVTTQNRNAVRGSLSIESEGFLVVMQVAKQLFTYKAVSNFPNPWQRYMIGPSRVHWESGEPPDIESSPMANQWQMLPAVLKQSYGWWFLDPKVKINGQDYPL